jgi:hypothetical protein
VPCVNACYTFWLVPQGVFKANWLKCQFNKSRMAPGVLVVGCTAALAHINGREVCWSDR